MNAQALAACRKIGDLLIRTFGDAPGQRDINKSGEHVGMAPDSVLEAIVLLYRATDDPRYQQFATYIVTHYDAPGGPAILASLEKTKSVRKVANAKAYEMTSNFNGILELYRVTGNQRYLDDMLTAWQDIADNRLYITGSASSYEVYQDDFHLPNGQNIQHLRNVRYRDVGADEPGTAAPDRGGPRLPTSWSARFTTICSARKSRRATIGPTTRPSKATSRTTAPRPAAIPAGRAASP